ncbi:MAG: hypothetical protein ACKN9C_07685, partial [Fluviibacter sp.]
NDGLKPGDRVVVTNVLRMSPNQLVTQSAVEAPEAQPIKLPTPPAETQKPNPYGAGAQVSSEANQAQVPKQQPMPVAPPTAPKLQPPKEVPLAPGVPSEPSLVPDSLQAPAPRAVQ